MVEFPAQSGRMRTLIHRGPIPRGHVTGVGRCGWAAKCGRLLRWKEVLSPARSPPLRRGGAVRWVALFFGTGSGVDGDVPSPLIRFTAPARTEV
jgi:hypothetical protein